MYTQIENQRTLHRRLAFLPVATVLILKYHETHANKPKGTHTTTANKITMCLRLLKNAVIMWWSRMIYRMHGGVIRMHSAVIKKKLLKTNNPNKEKALIYKVRIWPWEECERFNLHKRRVTGTDMTELQRKAENL